MSLYVRIILKESKSAINGGYHFMPAVVFIFIVSQLSYLSSYYYASRKNFEGWLRIRILLVWFIGQGKKVYKANFFHSFSL